MVYNGNYRESTGDKNMKEHQIAIRLDTRLLEKIDTKAQREKRNRSDMIRLILADALAPDAAIQAGKTQIDPSFFQGGRV
jgi:hypothetical protein